jgi:hypothetical protein
MVTCHCNQALGRFEQKPKRTLLFPHLVRLWSNGPGAAIDRAAACSEDAFSFLALTTKFGHVVGTEWDGAVEKKHRRNAAGKAILVITRVS